MELYIQYSVQSISSGTHTVNVLTMQPENNQGMNMLQSVNHISLKNRPRCYVKSPTVQDTFRSIPGLISCTGVTRKWGLLSHACNSQKQRRKLPSWLGSEHDKLNNLVGHMTYLSCSQETLVPGPRPLRQQGHVPPGPMPWISCPQCR